MCGIMVGRSYDVVARGLMNMKHRGPDGTTIVEAADGYFVGQNRLSIVDLSANARQPKLTWYGNSGKVTAFNGEIYNYGRVADFLRDKPPSGKRNEINTLHQLMDECKDFMRVLDGDFGIVHVDHRGELTLARDWVGVVPLYYQYALGGVVAASEKGAMLLGGSKIHEVQPGQTIRFRNGKRTHSWTWDPISLHLRMADSRTIRELFERAVWKRYLHSDVPVSVALSGGLDSSLILLTLGKADVNVRRQPLKAVTVVVDESDELDIAQRLAQDMKIEHVVVKLTEEEIRLEWDRILFHMESEDAYSNPIKWRGMVRNYFVAKYAKTKVILTGEGADEVFCGYPSHQNKEGLALEWKSFGTFKSMPAINLDRVNKGGMAWGAEYRVPFLDRDLALYAMSCYKIPEKQLLWELAQDMDMPEYVFQKPKYGQEEKKLGEIYERLVRSA